MSTCSRGDEDAAPSQRIVEHRALEVSPCIDVRCGNDDQVDRDTDVAGCLAESHETLRGDS